MAEYRAICTSEGVDPDVELLEAQLAGGVPAGLHVARRIAAAYPNRRRRPRGDAYRTWPTAAANPTLPGPQHRAPVRGLISRLRRRAVR